MPVSPSHTARIARFAPGRTAGDEQRAGFGAILRGVGAYPGDRVAHVGHLVGECHVRLQPVVRAHADETAPAGQVPDQRPRLAGLVAGVEAAAMEVQQDRHAGRTGRGDGIRPACGAARRRRRDRAPDHVAPTREKRGAQDAAPRPLRPAGCCATPRARAAPGTPRPPRPASASSATAALSGAARRVEVAVDRARARSTRSAGTPTMNGSSLTSSAGIAENRAEPAPPSERARHTPGHDRDRPPVPDRHQEPPTMRRHTPAGC